MPAYSLQPDRYCLAAWELQAVAPESCAAPEEIERLFSRQWVAAPDGTVAAMLRAAGRWSLDVASPRLDAQDWWLRTRFTLDADEVACLDRLHAGGLAGIADVWLNGAHVLHSDSMFVEHACAVQALVAGAENVLHIRFSSIDRALTARRPRPRWRAPLMEHQQLRWLRQSAFGRMPGWTPPAPPIGLWRPLWLQSSEDAALRGLECRAEVRADGVGVVHLAFECSVADDDADLFMELALEHDGRRHAVRLQSSPSTPSRWSARFEVPEPALWWPHTHGEPVLYQASLRIGGAAQGAVPSTVRLPPIGFRRIELDSADGDLHLRVNGVSIFCRGACWMPLDPVGLRSAAADYERALGQVREAGMNMVRVSGATIYEQAEFFDVCDRIGVLVWQEFMFANMDYPDGDTSFLDLVRVEAEQQLTLWRSHPCVAVVCGNSEVEQQAAMWGAPRELWQPPLFHRTLRDLVASQLPGVPYWPSSSCGGDWPHQSDSGSSSYYGVGAYLRGQDDARRAKLRFATESLGFANVPEPETLSRMPGGLSLRAHHPTWKTRVPRDLGAGWDFDDVRDHYLGVLFGVDPMRCRYVDHDRYLALSRIVTGEVMADAFGEWRRQGSGCRGALVWTLRDLWPGAGWGLLDDAGVPKACWYYLKRALQPLGMAITDEGGNGLAVHLVNDGSNAMAGTLTARLFGAEDSEVGRGGAQVQLVARGGVTIPLQRLFDGFIDLAYSYRFGPPPVRLVHVRFEDPSSGAWMEAFHFPVGQPSTAGSAMPLSVAIERVGEGTVTLRLEAHRLAQAVRIEVDDCDLSDNYFHMAPASRRSVELRPRPGRRPGPARIEALNCSASLVVDVPS